MIKLEVGKRYRDRSGEEYECVYYSEIHKKFFLVNKKELVVGRLENGKRADTDPVRAIYDMVEEIMPPVEVWVAQLKSTITGRVIYVTCEDEVTARGLPEEEGWRLTGVGKTTIVPGEGL